MHRDHLWPSPKTYTFIFPIKYFWFYCKKKTRIFKAFVFQLLLLHFSVAIWDKSLSLSLSSHLRLESYDDEGARSKRDCFSKSSSTPDEFCAMRSPRCIPKFIFRGERQKKTQQTSECLKQSHNSVEGIVRGLSINKIFFLFNSPTDIYTHGRSQAALKAKRCVYYTLFFIATKWGLASYR